MEKKTNRYLCIHGHFYQPPRENPWTGTIFYQRSAYPYHDWNERITRECYGPNTRSRLHGENGYINKLVNNFEFISYNFGPTLLNWLEKNNPWIYAQIINADRLSMDRFGGHGNAMAQVYNHLIMPLASERDKITQVKWGLADFHQRFNRKAEGMWLAETAVDSETLTVLANEGIKFTILSPYQAHLVRSFGSEDNNSAWKDVSGGNIDYTKPYRCFPTGEKDLFIDLFFYNGPLSKAIAYEKILSSGEAFLKRIEDTYPSEFKTPALLSMATDGESYGHHFKFGEMALTWVLEMVTGYQDIRLTNYGEFLDKFPPEMEVKIIEKSAWSCAHGVERWRSDCGCSVSQNPGWTQSWRTPLRNGLNWLNEHLASIFQEKTTGILKDSWKARDDYIHLILKPGEREKQTFLQEHAQKPLNEKESRLIFQLLESQQMALYMFTSCGWFFDDISGIEAIQVLMYAKKAIELCRDFSATDLEKGLKGFLSEAVCNDSRYENGMDVYNNEVIPLELEPLALLANYSMVCAIDDTRIPEWLKALISPEKEEKVDNAGIKVCICEIPSDNPHQDTGFTLVSAGIKTSDNDLKCIAGEIDKKTKETFLKELGSVALFINEVSQITGLFQKYFNNLQVFTLKGLIPDIKILAVKLLSDQMESRLFDSFADDISTVENYLRAVSDAKENIPAHLNDLLKSVFFNQFLKLLKKPGDIPVDLSKTERLLELIKHEPEEMALKDNNILIMDNLINQHRISVLVEEYLLDQLDKLQDKNININFINIIKLINFINKYKVAFDWWKCQNIFNDFRDDKAFIKRLDNTSLNLFRQIERLLGFTGGI